ncbi:zinc finger CCCH domain-containing protein 46-like [Amaranthus tricolor]|uniref:zinc finger CCCH domain-containing protein 46-like n=1 Tax=Amaranthus tricolor TaxID=29722 RepID=UPI00258AC13A|nr:zinc finger CCCH domain-containing protein 46-like [Amaranthus tricolor]XP_057515187.1 zinc finger CCCH domain-containing protein 46-like [Amaranthus tricolor]
MESYEATRSVFSRVQSIDPENASKIMGYILLNHGEKDMIRFAYGPETIIISIVNRAKNDLGLSSNTSSSSMVSPTSNPIAISRPNPLSLPLSSPRLANNGFNPSSPSSPSLWSHLSPNNGSNPSYAAVVNGSCSAHNGSFSSSIGSPQIGFSGNNSSNNGNRENFMDDFHHLQDQNLNFLNDPLSMSSKSMDFYEQSMDLAMSPGCRSDSMLYPYWENSNNGENHPHFHRRSASFNDMYYGTDDSTSGFGFKPCLYYAKGNCKNGSTCKFVHGENSSDAIVGSPCKYEVFEQYQEEIFRSKIAHQQRIAAQLMSGGMNSPYNKLNFLPTDAQRSAAAAMMMGEEFHKLNRVRMARNEFSGLDSNPGSRQIYLTFPADSTFKEEDVSNYFNLFGPVQDVRIPYQQKRMFGFVTFVYPETVKIILAKGNPHFVCDSRVLVKPYKEKSKLPDKKQHHQQLERGEFSSCSSPSGHDGRDPYEFQLGGRMLYSTQEMLMRKKLEEADLQQAIELQGRRLMNLQFLDLKNHQHQHNASVGSPIPSPNLPQMSSGQTAPPVSNGFNQDAFEDNNGSPSHEQVAEGVNVAVSDCNGNEEKPKTEENELSESGLEHILPDNLFASPKKSASEQRSSSLFFSDLDNGGSNAIPTSSSTANDSSMPVSSPLSLAPHKSCFFELPRLSTSQGALGI